MPTVLIESSELEAMLAAAVERALARRESESARPYSLREAARVARKRTELVAQALRSGALVAQRHGRNWRIGRESLNEWIAAGCPSN